MRALFAVAGAASIAASSAFVSPNVNLVANVLTVTGYTSLGSLDWEMADMMQGGFCSQQSGNTCEEVEYLSGVPNIGESSGLWALRAALNTAAPPTMVVGFSQGAMIATEWMLQYGDTASAPSPAGLSFVLMANPQRKYGGVRPVYNIDDPTPADTGYRVLDIAMEYDGAADVPDNLFNLLAVANAIAGFSHIHIDGYDDVDLDASEKLVWVDGNTTYVLIRSQNIPLLQPLRNLGLDALADRLNDPLKAIIDSAYDRDYVGLVDPELHDEVLAEFPHASDGAPAGAAAKSTPSLSVGVDEADMEAAVAETKAETVPAQTVDEAVDEDSAEDITEELDGGYPTGDLDIDPETPEEESAPSPVDDEQDVGDSIDDTIDDTAAVSAEDESETAAAADSDDESESSESDGDSTSTDDGSAE